MQKADTDPIDVRYVANLARIELTPAEVDSLSGELDKILAFVHQLDELDLEGVEPLSHPNPRENVYREDSPLESLDPDPVMANAPSEVQRLVRVPQMME